MAIMPVDAVRARTPQSRRSCYGLNVLPPNVHAFARSPCPGNGCGVVVLIGWMYSGYGGLLGDPFHPAGRNGGSFGTFHPSLANVRCMDPLSTAFEKFCAVRARVM